MRAVYFTTLSVWTFSNIFREPNMPLLNLLFPCYSLVVVFTGISIYIFYIFSFSIFFTLSTENKSHSILICQIIHSTDNQLVAFNGTTSLIKCFVQSLFHRWKYYIIVCSAGPMCDVLTDWRLFSYIEAI